MAELTYKQAFTKLRNIKWRDFLLEQERALEEDAKRTFERQGPGWPALSPRYAAWKAARYGQRPMLRATDRLFDSVTRRTGDSVRSGSGNVLKFGTKVPYARAHQYGTGNLPARPFLSFNVERISADMRGFLMRQV